MNRAQRRAQTHGKAPRDFVIDYSWRMIFSAAGLVMHRHGIDDDQIGDMLIEIQQVIDEHVAAGGNAGTIIKKLEEETGIVLARGGGR